MPTSQQPQEGQDMMLNRVLRHPGSSVLDVGPGEGRWGELLRGKVYRIDAVEIWKPYIRKYQLRDKYDSVLHADVMSLVDSGLLPDWDIVILSDVLEHLSKEDGLKLLEELKEVRAYVLLSIPTGGKTEQDGKVYGNPYETHVSKWSREELVGHGFTLLQEGTNPNGLVVIGTYELGEASDGSQ